MMSNTTFSTTPSDTIFMNQNSLMVIYPFKHAGIWMFSDETTHLVNEPFVGHVNNLMDWLTRNIPNAENGFRLIFGAKPFPEYGMMLRHVREEHEGNWYVCDALGEEPGWLCPALYRYFQVAPPTLYMKAEAIE